VRGLGGLSPRAGVGGPVPACGGWGACPRLRGLGGLSPPAGVGGEALLAGKPAPTRDFQNGNDCTSSGGKRP